MLTRDELVDMLHGQAAETFHKPGGSEFEAVFQNGTVDALEMYASSPVLMAIEADVSELVQGDLVFRVDVDPKEVYEVRAVLSFGNDTFATVDIRKKDA